jgi:hypothetical protein
VSGTERAQCEYLCKNVEAAEQLFSEVVEHAKDAWEKNEVYIQRNQMSTCMQRYDVRTPELRSYVPRARAST